MSETLVVPGLEVAWATHVGRVRKRNEDAVGVVPLPEGSGVLLVVCDGMGGHAGGEVASRIALKRLLKVSRELAPERPPTERYEAVLRAFYNIWMIGVVAPLSQVNLIDVALGLVSGDPSETMWKLPRTYGSERGQESS